MNKNHIFQHTYFIDRALGKSVGEALQNLGVQVEFHKDHLLPDSPDQEWLPIVSQKSWVILTKDTNIGRNHLEIRAMAISNAKIFTLVSANLNTATMVNVFSEAIVKIDNIATSNPAPFIAKIYKNANVRLWKNKNQLKKILKSK